jgi:diguanylate cyclase (GGDEF)-like protein
MPRNMPSRFAERLGALTDEWARRLPPDLQQRFKADFQLFGIEHDETLDTIETIWNRRQRDYEFDESTGLARRRPFHDYLATLLDRSSSAAMTAVSVLFIDLDNLKRINDTSGHDVGDRALAAIGRIIRETIRIDQHIDFVTPWRSEHDYAAARHGGDEFLVALELKALADVKSVACRLKRSIDDPERQSACGYDGRVPLKCSLGGVVYELPVSPQPLAASVLAQELIRAADERMYASKRDGMIHLAAARFADRIHIDRDYASLQP